MATELGIALAKGGDDIHFISYALPSRLNVTHERVRFHEVTVTPYPLAAADRALADLAGDRVNGAAVLVPD